MSVEIGATRQQQLLTAVVNQHAHEGLYEQFTGSLDAQRLVQVYSNNFVSRFCDALSATFAKTEAMVGEAYFKHLAKGFVQDCPFAEASLLNFGAEFPAYMNQQEALQSLPYLPDLARLEWAMEEAYNSGSGEELDTGLYLGTGIALISSDYALYCLWGFDGSEPFDVTTQSEWVLVYRRAYEVRLRLIEPDVGAFMRAFVDAPRHMKLAALAALSQQQIEALINLGLLSRGEHHG